jgi:hypothetical protein
MAVGLLVAVLLGAVALPASTSAMSATHIAHNYKPSDGVGDSPLVP